MARHSRTPRSTAARRGSSAGTTTAQGKKAAQSARGGARGADATARTAAPQAGERRQRGSLIVGFVPGVEPDTFARRWRTDPGRDHLTLVPVAAHEQERALASGEVHMILARLPWAPDAAMGEEQCQVVRLWEEKTVAVLARDSIYAEETALTLADLEGEHEFAPAGAREADDAKERIEIVASGVGYTLMPMSLARLHHRKDTAHVIVSDLPRTWVAIVWPKEAVADGAPSEETCQEFVGVLRGRTARSSRSR
ncbi:MAG: LysR family transcriptional regulator substrate-binding protein [Dermabacter sp.]|nr:LysR family transcriptional regulator substrate-binding protein [Dermabacter sp.]